MYGPTIVGASAASSEDDIKTSLRSFTKVLSTVEDNFADKVSPDRAIYKGGDSGHGQDPRSRTPTSSIQRTSSSSAKTSAATTTASA